VDHTVDVGYMQILFDLLIFKNPIFINNM